MLILDGVHAPGCKASVACIFAQSFRGGRQSCSLSRLSRETLTTAAQLRMGASASPAAVEKTVNGLIKRLGLTTAANTIVGNAKVRGLSGGERKRLSIACELLGDPALLFCDEPTTGLDSFQAEQVSQLSKLGAIMHERP